MADGKTAQEVYFYRYLRDDLNRPIGCVAAIVYPHPRLTNVVFGVSLWNPADRWDRKLGRKIAIGRARSKTRGRQGLPAYMPDGRLTMIRDTIKSMLYSLRKRWPNIRPM